MEVTKKHWLALFVIVIISSFLINLTVTLTSPIVFGDEGLYASRGTWIWEHKQIPNYYHIQSQSQVFKNYFIRPPYMMALLAAFFGIGGEAFVKILLPFVNIMTAIVVFLFVKKAYSIEAGVLASIFLIVIPSFITSTILLYAELLALLAMASSFFFLYIGLTEKKDKYLLLSGACAGISALTDVGGFLIPIIYLFTLLIFRSSINDFLRKFMMLLIVFGIVIAPWYFIHNYLQANTFGIPLIDRFTKGSSLVIVNPIPENLATAKPSFIDPAQIGGGTNSNILKMGITNYIDFAYTGGLIAMASIGLIYMALNRRKLETFIIMWLLVLFLVNYYLTADSRAEDAARALVYTTVPLSIIAGVASERIYSGIKGTHKTGKYIAIIFVVILLGWSISTANSKAQNLKPIKQFSASFFQACDWIKQNTEEGALLVNLWQHRTEYACRRDTIWISDPGVGEAVAAHDNRTYEIFKLHGATYIFIQKFSISSGNEGESYPTDFVNYIINSPNNYKLAYETDENCLAKKEISDCSLVYKIL